MRWRSPAVVLGCVVFVLCAPSLSAGQGKSSNETVPVTVEFRGATGDGITGGPVSGAIYVYPGTLSVRTAAPFLNFNFDSPRLQPPTPNCRVWGEAPSYGMSMPDDLSSGSSVFIHSYSEFQFVEDGTSPGVDKPEEWREIKDDRGRTVYFDLLGLEGGQKAYVQVVFRLTLATTNDFYDVNFNRTWDAPAGWNGGIFVVEADDANTDGTVDVWRFRPLDEWEHRAPYLGPSEANLRLIDMSDGRRDPGGVCTLGNFYMPFEMTVTRK